uniref:Uncharacterized protein n=1 Tax=Romanomermis culicivorax TaxID=13658 RepID=A0A915J2T6_ROMCU
MQDVIIFNGENTNYNLNGSSTVFREQILRHGWTTVLQFTARRTLAPINLASVSTRHMYDHSKINN